MFWLAKYLSLPFEQEVALALIVYGVLYYLCPEKCLTLALLVDVLVTNYALPVSPPPPPPPSLTLSPPSLPTPPSPLSAPKTLPHERMAPYLEGINEVPDEQSQVEVETLSHFSEKSS